MAEVHLRRVNSCRTAELCHGCLNIRLCRMTWGWAPLNKESKVILFWLFAGRAMNIQMATSEIPSVLRGGRVGSGGYSQGRTQSRVGGGRGRGELYTFYYS